MGLTILNFILAHASFFSSPLNDKSNSYEFPDVTGSKLQVAEGVNIEIFLHAY